MSMLFSYLKIVLRNLGRQKTYSLLIISCLTIGLSIFILAVSYADFHFRFDSFHRDIDRTFMLIRTSPSTHGGEMHRAAVPLPLMPLLLYEFPEIEDATRVIPTARKIIRCRDRLFYENKVYFADANFLSFFSFKMVSPISEGILREPNSVVITESTALKYFGEEDPIGRVLTLEEDGLELRVSGVTEDVPVNSSITYDLLVSSSALFGRAGDWEAEGVTFLRLMNAVNPERLQAKLPTFAASYIPGSAGRGNQFHLLPLSDLHLRSGSVYGDGFNRSTAMQFYIVIAAAVILLLIICLNFMHLATAKYMNRAREVGLRKVVGAHRHQLIGQFLGESLFLSILALPAAMALCEILRPAFRAVIGVEEAISVWSNPGFVIVLLAVAAVLGMISGSYPALFLSAFNATRIFRKDALAGSGGIVARKILITSQFALTAVLLVIAMLTCRQLDFLTKSDRGYNADNIVVLPAFWNLEGYLQPLRQALLQHPQISSVAAANELPFEPGIELPVRVDGESERGAWTMNAYAVDYDYIDALEMTMLRGRSFAEEFDDAGSYVISELASRQLGFEDPVGKMITVGDARGTVIGVVKDFQLAPAFTAVTPCVLYVQSDRLRYVVIKLARPPDMGVMTQIRDIWRRVMTDMPYEFFMLEQRFQETVRNSTRAAQAVAFTSIISVAISCSGLLGLAFFTIERRRREIGVRKVLGASVPKIVTMFITEFVKLLILAHCVAVPFAYYSSHLYLKWGLVQRVEIGASVFIAAATISFIAAIISVLFQTVMAGQTSPCEALRYE